MRPAPPILGWLVLALIGVATGLYGLYWKVVHDRAIVIVGDQIEAWRLAGYDVRWSEMRSGGFPLSVEAVFADPVIASPPGREAWSWTGEGLRVSLRPWALDTYTVEPRGLHSVTSRIYGALDAEAHGLTVRIRSDGDGLRALRLTSGPAAVVRHLDGATLLAANALDARLDRDAADAGRFAFLGEARELEWLDGDDAEPERAAAHVELGAADVLAAQRGLDARALSAWAAADGDLVIHEARLDWLDSALAADGALSVNENGELVGAIGLESSAPSRAIAHLAALGMIDEDAMARIEGVTRVLGDNEMRIDLEVRAGQAYLLGLPLGPLPRVF